jgi:hypothetical protein
MTKLASSPDRHTFQAEAYIKRCQEEGKEPREDYLNMFKTIKEQASSLEEDPEWRENNMEYDMRSTPWFIEKCQNDTYAQNLYAAMCNMRWQRYDVLPILKDQYWSASWRSAGGIVANLQGKGDYMDWYCSGMGGFNREYEGNETNEQWQKRTGYVPEGVVTEEIEKDLFKLGWIPAPWPEDDL